MDVSNLERLNAARRARRAVIQITDLRTGRDRVVIEGETTDEALTSAIGAAFRSGKSATIDAGGEQFFLNVYLPLPQIVVIGAVHISQILAEITAPVGFNLRIIDPRTAFATSERFAGTDLVADWPVDVFREYPLDAYSAVVAVSHDPKIDDLPIAEALRAHCFYVGALGSRKTHAARLERLKADGFTDDDLARIHAPIGLNIGAASPAEIAVAILAEIIQTLRARDIAPQRTRCP
jgi:xanthine dehydrogenase accessory factor